MNGYIPTPPPFLSEEEIDNLKNTILKGYSEHEQMRFIRVCQRTLLDPFSNQVYATRRYTKNKDGSRQATLVIVTSALGLTAIAARTGFYDGCVITWAGPDGVWRDEWLGDEFPSAAKCIVYHKQRSHPEIGIARWEGYAGKQYDQATKRWEVSDFWARLPDFMLAKCAKAQALRGAFPDQCAQLYISEELHGGISEADEAPQVDEEARLLDIRKKEAELLKKVPPGAKVVGKPAPAPTKEETEPAFEEEKTPPKPMSAPAPAQTPPAAPPEQPDDLDMEPTAAAPTPAEGSAGSPAGDRVSVTPWKTHVIKGLKNEKYFNRMVGDLSPTELAAVEASWIPKVRKVWDEVNALQKEDCAAFEAAIAFYKMEKFS